MAGIFLSSTHWKSYDYFSAIKTSTFRSSRVAVLELASKYNSLVKQLSSPPPGLSAAQREEAEQILLTEMLEISLWGNATDLSLLASSTYVDIASLQGAEARRKAEANILVNDVQAALSALRSAKDKPERRVDIVLDNSGFELFVDLALAGYLIHSGLATTVVFHPKDMPWFVSDVVPRDFAGLFAALPQGGGFFGQLSEVEEADLAALAGDWAGLHAEGQVVLRPNGFWTEGGSFWRLPATAGRLYEDLKESELVVFKGDLNYRKLTADVSMLGSWKAMLLTIHRRSGSRQSPLQRRLDRSARAVGYASCPCAHARPTWLLDCQRVAMGSYARWRAVVATQRANGRGRASGR